MNNSRLCLPVIVLLAALGAAPGIAQAQPSDYRLGPEDKLQIKVFDWRTGSGEAYQWQALNGEFTVAASGAVSLPLLGDVAAADATPSDLARTIGERLQARIGLAQRPEASVQVIKYRPFYVTGGVERPGEFEFHPDLSVLQAVSIAGGFVQPGSRGDLVGLERQVLEGRGDLRALTAERSQLLIRQARIDAEIGLRDSLQVPADLDARRSEPEIARALREEQALYDTRKEALRSQTDTLNQSRALLERQIIALAAKDASLAHQLAVTRQELDQISGLVSSGLAVLPRKLAIEENAAQYESSRLDVQLATLRAQQDISKALRDGADLRAKDRNEALLEAAQVRTRLAEIAERLQTTGALVREAEVRAPAMLGSVATGSALPTPVYAIIRKVDGRAVTLDAGESDALLPGDVLRVTFDTPDETGHRVADVPLQDARAAAMSN